MNPIWYHSVAEKHKVTGSFSSPQLLGNVEAPSSEKTEMRLIPVSNLPNSILLGEGCLIASDLGHSPPRKQTPADDMPALHNAIHFTDQKALGATHSSRAAARGEGSYRKFSFLPSTVAPLPGDNQKGRNTRSTQF